MGQAAVQHTSSNEPVRPQERRDIRLRVQIAALFVVSLLVFYLSFHIVQPFIPALLWALALGIVADPLHLRIRKKVRRPNIAAGLSVTVVALAIILPLSFAARQFAQVVAENSETVNSLMQPGTWRSLIERNPSLSNGVEWADRNFGLSQSLSESSAILLETGRAIVKGSIWSLVQMLLILFTLFYFYRDRDAIIRGAKAFLPLTESDSDRVFGEVYDTVQSTIYGSVLVAVIQGTLGGLMFWILGIPGAALWGVIMAIVSVIPYLGSFIVWGPAALYLWLQGEMIRSLILTGWGLIVVGLIDNLLYPIFVGTRMRFHTLPVFFFLIGGISFFGASGLILGPVTLAVVDALYRIWRERTEGKTAPG